ncbi:MAG: hypothetical protein ABI647_13520 [Gemmatimonadota bacterium]
MTRSRVSGPAHVRVLARITTVLWVGLAACSQSRDREFLSQTDVPVAAVLKVEPQTISLRSGDEAVFSARVLSSAGARMPEAAIDWSATGGRIDAGGRFVAAGSGQARVVARLRDRPLVADSASVGVWRDPLEVSELKVLPESTIVQTNEPVQLSTASLLANGGTSQSEPVRWQTDGGEVSAAGAFVAAKEGRYVVSATTKNGVTSTSVVIVKSIVRAIVGVIISPAKTSVVTGGSAKFSVQGALNTGGRTGADVDWTAFGGTIDANGVFVAGSQTGTYRVIAQLQGGTAADTATVTVNAPLYITIAVSPASATLTPGSTLKFNAIGKRANGTTASVAPTWQATGGTIKSTGVYTAGTKAGTFRVIGTMPSGVADTAPVVIKSGSATLTSIVLSPANASVAAGLFRDFTVGASWSDGSATVPAITWSATGGKVAAGGRYTAGSAPGSYRVIAAANGKADTAAVTVTAPILTAVKVAPGTANLQFGQTLQFSATGTLSTGGSSPPTVAWSASAGSISAAGLFTGPATAGTVSVIATAAGGLADTAYVTVGSTGVTMTSLSVSPTSTILGVGAGQAFTAQARWSNSTTTTPAVTWTATGGTITKAGYYVAGPTAGTYRVIGSAGGFADTVAISVTAGATLTSVRISPKTTILKPGAYVQFSVSGWWSNGATTTPKVTWSGTGGKVNSGGFFTAGPVGGVYYVIATSNQVADTAIVTINGPTGTPTLQSIVLSPGSANLTASGSLQFMAVGLLSDGSLQLTPITWSVQGGSMTSGGLYTAGPNVGTYRIIAVQQGGTLADTAMVTVNPATGGFPAGYDPSRLGSELLVGQSWQGLSIGSDSGYSSIVNVGAFRQATSPYPAPTPGELMVDADPVFGKAVRIVQPDYHPKKFASTVEGFFQFKPATRFWFRSVIRVSGNGNRNGALGAGFTSYGTGLNGGSTTYKLLFAWPDIGSPPNRMEFTLYNSGELANAFGNVEPGRVETRLVQTVGTPVPPVSWHLGTWMNGEEWRTSGDWYEFVMNYEMVSPTEYIQRYFQRRLTVNGIWNPWQYPAWLGYRIANGKSFAYSSVNLGGNKSQTNDGPFDQFLWWGPFEVTSAPDPYGWDRYGK